MSGRLREWAEEVAAALMAETRLENLLPRVAPKGPAGTVLDDTLDRACPTAPVDPDMVEGVFPVVLHSALGIVDTAGIDSDRLPSKHFARFADIVHIAFASPKSCWRAVAVVCCERRRMIRAGLIVDRLARQIHRALPREHLCTDPDYSCRNPRTPRATCIRRGRSCVSVRACLHRIAVRRLEIVCPPPEESRDLYLCILLLCTRRGLSFFVVYSSSGRLPPAS